FERTRPGQRFYIHAAKLFSAQAAGSGDYSRRSVAAGVCAGACRTRAVLRSTGQLEGNLATVPGDFAALRLSRQRSGAAADGNLWSGRDLFRGGFDRSATLRNHDGAHSRTTGARARL